MGGGGLTRVGRLCLPNLGVYGGMHPRKIFELYIVEYVWGCGVIIINFITYWGCDLSIKMGGGGGEPPSHPPFLRQCVYN